MVPERGPGRSGGRLRSALARRVGIDTRALAAFRIAVGGLLVLDLLLRSRHLRAFYTDAGVVPRSVNAQLYPTLSGLSVHALSGAAWVQAALFVVAAVAAVLLAVGYRTRPVGAVAWVLLSSLQFRNYVVLNGGDTALLVVLFLGLLLPMGERWSVDALSDDGRKPRTRVAGFASAALLSQVVLIYATNAVFKLRSDVWTDGVAVLYVLQVDRFTIRLGDLLAEFAPILVLINWTWLAMLVASPLLVAAAGRVRTALVAAFIGAHVGMWLTMDLGLFPHAMVAGLFVFLPPPVWDRLEDGLGPLAGRLETHGQRVRHSGGLLPRSVRTTVGRVAPVVTGTVLVVGLLWQAIAVGYVASPDAMPVDPADHSWKLFAPNPPQTDGYFVAVGTLSTGTTVDLYPHADTARDRPPDTAATYPSTRWRKYLTEVRRSDLLRRQFADYLCRRGAERYGEPVDDLTIEYVREPVRLDGPNPTDRVRLGRYSCPVAG